MPHVLSKNLALLCHPVFDDESRLDKTAPQKKNLSEKTADFSHDDVWQQTNKNPKGTPGSRFARRVCLDFSFYLKFATRRCRKSSRLTALQRLPDRCSQHIPPPSGMAQSVTYGIVGVGLMGIEHIRNLLVIEGARITCIADDFPASIKSCMAMLHNESPETAAAITIYSSATDLFTANICDVAVISTPNHTHHAILMDAYAHARPEMHVLVEKPLCTTVDHCREVLDAAKVRRGITWVGMEYSYMPPTNRLIADVRSGLIGPVRMCSIREHRFPFLQKVRNWNRFSANSGGTLVGK